jgi:hypothetical protein
MTISPPGRGRPQQACLALCVAAPKMSRRFADGDEVSEMALGGDAGSHFRAAWGASVVTALGKTSVELLRQHRVDRRPGHQHLQRPE